MIQGYRFGWLKIEDKSYTKDLKIIDFKIICPWWRITGHVVEIEDVQDILQIRPEVIVLGKGDPGLMQSSFALQEKLKEMSIHLIEKPSKEAVQIFNTYLKKGSNVCAGFHLTC